MGGASKRNSIAVAGSSVTNNRKKRKMTKSKSLSDLGNDDQQVPRKMQEFMTFKEQRQQKKKEVKKTPNKMETINEEVVSSTPSSAFKRAFGETEYQFNKRMNDEVSMIIAQSKAIPDREPEKEVEEEKKKQRKREKRRAREIKKKEKKERRKSEANFQQKEKSMLSDKVNFGEVVLRPPELTFKMPAAIAKKQKNQPQKKTYNFMKMFKTDGNKILHKK